MSISTNTLFKEASEKAGWQLGLVTKNDLILKKSSLSSFQKQHAHSAFTDTDQLPVDAIYFSGENPFIHFKQLNNYDPSEVLKLHHKIWNEGRIPLLAVITPQEIRLYDCYDTPKNSLSDLNKLERACFAEYDLEKLGQLLHQSKIDSGIIWKEQFGKSIKTKNRVDRKLLNNLKAARSILSEDFHFPLEIIHDLLSRSLFSLYLEDRGILTPDIYPSRPNDVKDFIDLLDHHESTYELFHFLQESFNGDLFPITKKEKRIIKKYPDCLGIIKDCFSGHTDFATGQMAFPWRMFQFQYIPIEFISSIYEEFMSKEDEGHQRIKRDGAVYTPQMLVEFVLNEVLPWPDEKNKKYDIKILDPACGSGIFLVESYKRLIARWKYVNRNKDINEKILEQLLLNNIYGIEKDSAAIKIAAFSLYLTYLNYIEPKKVLTKVKFKPLVRWKEKNESYDNKNEKPGNNLFQFSTFDKELEIFKNKFDVIVGNPPWKLGKSDDDVNKYIANNKLPQQIMCAYLHYIPKFVSNGVISLISTAKILFNTGKGYDNFRRWFFTNNNVDTIINLSVLRDIVFKNATAPGTVFIYRKNNSGVNDYLNEFITYCVPKSIETIKHRQSIVIDSSDIKFLPVREILKENSKVFKVAMWGNVRDLKFIERLQFAKNIDEVIGIGDKGGGLHIKEEKKPYGNESLMDHYFIPPEKIDQYYITKKGLKKLGDNHLKFRVNNHNIFKKPVVLINEGSKGSEFCCSYVNYNCAYKKSVYGIAFRNKNDNFHKAFVAFLNSTIASYYFFITSSSWGIDKGGRVQNNDAISFPALPYSMSEKKISKLAGKVDEIIRIKNSDTIEFNEKQRIEVIRDQIDEIIYKELNITSNERSLIYDVLNYSIVLHNRYKAANAEGPVNFEKHMIPFVKSILETINSTLKHKDKGVWIEIFKHNNGKNILNIIALHFTNDHNYGSYKLSMINNISKHLKEINKYTYEQHSESIYYRKVVKYYSKNVIYLIKPNQKRFWSISQALNDADDIITEIIN